MKVSEKSCKTCKLKEYPKCAPLIGACQDFNKWHPKSKWLPATEENLVVGEWYWVKMAHVIGFNGKPRRIVTKLTIMESEFLVFEDINGIRDNGNSNHFEIQPATAPPSLEG